MLCAGSGVKAMERYVALLRGVNVGGNNVLPMRELAAIFAGAGCVDVVTYIQSGNVVFGATGRCVAGLAPVIEAGILERFGIASPVVVRSAAEMRRVLAANPFAGASEEMLHVYFLREAPALAKVRGVDYGRSAPDAFAVEGREIFLHLPAGMARTKLTNGYFDKALGTVCTARNWKTVAKLTAMLDGDGGVTRRGSPSSFS